MAFLHSLAMMLGLLLICRTPQRATREAWSAGLTYLGRAKLDLEWQCCCEVMMFNLLVKLLLITSLGCRNCVKRLSNRLRSHKSYNETQAAFLQILEFPAMHVSSFTRGASRLWCQLPCPTRKLRSTEPYSVPGLCASHLGSCGACHFMYSHSLHVVLLKSLKLREILWTSLIKTGWPSLSPPSSCCLPSRPQKCLGGEKHRAILLAKK